MIKTDTKLFLCFLLFIHTLYCIPILGHGIINTHDGLNHTARIASFSQALLDGHVPPRWAANLNFGYGTPVFIFFSPLPYYTASLLTALGSGYEVSFTLIAFASFVLAPITMYFYLRNHVRNTSAFIGGLLYGLAPNHFLNIYIRGDIGELFGYALIPLALLALDRIDKHPTIQSFIVAGCAYAFVVLSHNFVAIIFTVLAIMYSILFKISQLQRTEDRISHSGTPYIVSLLVSSAVRATIHVYWNIFKSGIQQTLLSCFSSIL